MLTKLWPLHQWVFVVGQYNLVQFGLFSLPENWQQPPKIIYALPQISLNSLLSDPPHCEHNVEICAEFHLPAVLSHACTAMQQKYMYFMHVEKHAF